MNKKLAKANAMIVLTAAALIFSIIALCSLNGSFAWFSNSRTVDANGMSIASSAPPQKDVVVEWYQVESVSFETEEDGSITETYKFAENSVDAPMLGTYTVIEPKRQVLMKLTGRNGEYINRIEINSSVSEYVMPDLSNSGAEASNSMSAVVQFRPVALKNSNDNEVVVDKNSSQPIRFASLTPVESGVMTTEFTPKLEIVPPVASTEVYILIDYYEDSAKYIQEQFDAMAASNGEITKSEVKFSCDFVFTVT